MLKPGTSKLLYTIALIAAAIGFAVSGYSLSHHYSDSTETFCDISSAFNCSTVNKSIYSEIAGVPVAAVGVLGYGLLALLLANEKLKKEIKYPFAASLIGLAFQGYLTYIEFGVLYTACLLCLTSQAVIATVALCTGILYFKGGPAKPPEHSSTQ